MNTNKHPRTGTPDRLTTGYRRLWRQYLRRQGSVASFGARLKRARKERGFSVSRLARKSRISPFTIADLESDRRAPMVDEIRQLAGALDVAIDELMDA